MEGMDEDCQAIIEAKSLFLDSEILPQLAIIRGNFSQLVHTITALEERLPLVRAMELVENLKDKLTLEPFAAKLHQVLDKNPGFNKMQQITKVLRGSEEAFEGSDANATAMMGNAPLVTCDVERTFSTLKDINSHKRASLTEDHIKDIMIIQWNSKCNL